MKQYGACEAMAWLAMVGSLVVAWRLWPPRQPTAAVDERGVALAGRMVHVDPARWQPLLWSANPADHVFRLADYVADADTKGLVAASVMRELPEGVASISTTPVELRGVSTPIGCRHSVEIEEGHLGAGPEGGGRVRVYRARNGTQSFNYVAVYRLD
jgi:hypothetical protein